MAKGRGRWSVLQLVGKWSSDFESYNPQSLKDVPATDRLTVATYLSGWVTGRIPGTVTTRTEELYARAVRDYINPSLGKIRLNKLAPADVSRMLQDLEVRGYSPATKRMARATLRRALRMAEQDGLLNRNVASIAEGPKSGPHRRSESVARASEGLPAGGERTSLRRRLRDRAFPWSSTR